MRQGLPGAPTFHTRVEHWECDHNRHWNARFYLRSFQQASYVIDAKCTSRQLSDGTGHYRFHRELFEMSPVEVRSLIISDGEYQGHLVHLLLSDGQLSATALQGPPDLACELPGVSCQDVAEAMPRGLDAQLMDAKEFRADQLEMGVVQPSELDHTGSLALENLMKRIAILSHVSMTELGFNAKFTREQNVSRMNIEMRLQQLGRCGVGARLVGKSRLARVESKSFVLRYLLESEGIGLVALVEQCLLAVDLQKRSVVSLPDFNWEAIGDPKTIYNHRR